ncbi:hypothetical protein BH09VER1_BH09VER1_45920 [soil metagenome]
MNPRPPSGLSLIELLVVLCLIAILWSLSLPAIGVGLVKGEKTQTLSNMKQLHLATQQMALDSTTTGDTNIGWPGDTGGSFERWATNLVAGNYLSTNDLCKLLSAKGRVTPPGSMPRANNNAVLVYAVREASDGKAVFLSTANFTNTPTGGLPPQKSALPYGQTGFVVFHKAGDGVILANRQAGPGYTNLIGSYVPLCTSDPRLLASPSLVGFTREELMVAAGAALLVLGLLIFGLLKLRRRRPAQTPAMRARQMLESMKQLHGVTQQMALDAETTGDPELGWPGDTGGSFARWAAKLVEGGYVKPWELRAMLEGVYDEDGPPRGSKRVPRENTHAIRVYAVRKDSPGHTIFLSSANFTNTLEGGTVVEDSTVLNGKFFVIMTLKGKAIVVPIHPPEGDEGLPWEYLPAEQWAMLPRAYAPLCH